MNTHKIIIGDETSQIQMESLSHQDHVSVEGNKQVFTSRYLMKGFLSHN